MTSSKSVNIILSLVNTLCITSVIAYDGTTCCDLAKLEGAFISPFPTFENQTCGQTYSTSLAASSPLYVDYRFCSSRCSGMGLSKASQPSEWAAPLVQFILPSVIFRGAGDFGSTISFNFFARLSFSQSSWYPVLVDTIVWISVIVVGAGNMLVGGLFEAHLDYRLVEYVKSMESDTGNLDIKRELLVTIASGNLLLDKNKGLPLSTIPKSIVLPGPGKPDEGSEKSRSRLLNLIGAQSSFGGAVGSPVLFYLGAFVYTILDLRNDPSNQDASISLGFGIEWMVIVHVAIVSGCLLASNNPSTAAGIVGSDHEVLKESRHEFPIQRAPSTLATQRDGQESSKHSRGWHWFSHSILGWSDAYDTEFQPVSLWSRGSNKLSWIKDTKAWEEKRFQELMSFTISGWVIRILFPALLLIVLPPATGGVVAFFTPPQGIACRSLSFIIYAVSQIIIAIIATISCAVDTQGEQKTTISRVFTGKGFIAISTPFWISSFAAGIGGTTLQIVGVYRNCACYGIANVPISLWLHLRRANPLINLASDTQDARNSSLYWIWMGGTATVFMAVNCYIGWWYQRLIRHRFTDAVKAMYMEPQTSASPTQVPVAGTGGGSKEVRGNRGSAEGLLATDGSFSGIDNQRITSALDEQLRGASSLPRRRSLATILAPASRPSTAGEATEEEIELRPRGPLSVDSTEVFQGRD